MKSSFMPLADATPMLNDLVHAVNYTTSLLYFYSSYTTSVCCSLKQSSFWVLADAKHIFMQLGFSHG
jgi:hypothetical protein